MLVTLNDVLIPAKKGKYAVGLFNAVNLELARGIIAAAEETGSPVIMGTAEVLLQRHRTCPISLGWRMAATGGPSSITQRRRSF